MPNSFGSEDSHLSASELLPPLSENSSRSSQSTPASTPHWAFEDTAFSDRKLDASSPQKFNSDVLRPEALRAFSSASELPTGAALESHGRQSLEQAAMATIGRSTPSLPGSAGGCHQQSQQQHSHRQPPQQRAFGQSSTEMEGHQQAANYASLANLGPSTAAVHGLATGDNSVESWTALNDPSYAGAVRLLTENLLLSEAAPRLSTSSIESTVTSELHTPDNCHQPWSLIEPGYPPEDLEASHYTQSDGRLLSGLYIGDHASQDDQKLSEAAQTERSATLKRPAQLSRLSSNATNVTAKPSPPTSSTSSPAAPEGYANPKTRGAASMHVSRDGVQGQPANAAASTPSVHGAPTYSPTAASAEIAEDDARVLAGTGSRKILASPDSWRSLLPEHDPFFVPESSFSPQVEQSFAKTVGGAPAPASPRHATTESGSSRAFTDSGSNGRNSFSSVNAGRPSFSSSFSHQSSSSAGGAMADTDSWRSFLPDSDRFSLRNAPSPQLGGHASPQPDADTTASSAAGSSALEAPIILDVSGHRAAFMALRGMPGHELAQQTRDAFARRHASFSSYETTGNASMPGTSRAAMESFRRPTVVEAINSKRGGPSVVASPSDAGPSMSRGSSNLSSNDGHTHRLAWSTSSCSVDFDDHEDRESWPTSRGRSQQLSVVASDAESSSRSVAPTIEVDSSEAASDQGSASKDPRGGGQVAETSSSVLESTPDGLVATTTTKTMRTTTVTRLIAPNPGAEEASGSRADDGPSRGTPVLTTEPEPAGVESDGDAPKAGRRSASCSISAPLSPPSLPFLDSRPAPPETELLVKTSNTHYTLVTHLPGFSLDCITLATKQHKNHRTLHLVADKFDEDDGGHFERRVTFPEGECDLVGVRAEFDGTTLRIFVPRRESFRRGFSSASSATF